MKEIFDTNDESAVKILASSMSKEEFTVLLTEWVTENLRAVVHHVYKYAISEYSPPWLGVKLPNEGNLFGVLEDEFFRGALHEDVSINLTVKLIINHLYTC